MLKWLFVNFLGDSANPVSESQKSAQALLSSAIGDGDVVTDWMYFRDIAINNTGIPQWLSTLHLLTCIFGTLSWICVFTDGRFANLIRSTMILISYIPFFIKWFFLWSLRNIMERCYDYRSYHNSYREEKNNRLYDWIDENQLWINHDMLPHLKEKLKGKRSFSSGSLLFVGIVLEDIPQLVISLVIENKIHSGNPIQNLSTAAMLNLTFAIFDIFHKLAEAYDLRNDLINLEYSTKRTIRAHNHVITSLVEVGTNQILSRSQDGTVKLWDTVSGNRVRKFKCESTFMDVVVIEPSYVITACRDKCIRVFNTAGGRRNTRLKLNFRPDFICVSPNRKSIFTGGSMENGFIERWDDLQSEKCSFTYSWTATAIEFLEEDFFVSIDKNKSVVHVGNINEKDPIQTFEELEIRSVLALSSTMFLIGDAVGRIHQFKYSGNIWKLTPKIQQLDTPILSLTRVNESLFLASDGPVANLYNIEDPTTTIFQFRGHTSWIWTSVFLKEQNTVASGDENGHIKIWSIEKYLEDNTLETPPNCDNNNDTDVNSCGFTIQP